ncbi:MAG: phosphoadenosine phosphosulfate reductase family protein [Rickettsiales bacterium]
MAIQDKLRIGLALPHEVKVAKAKMTLRSFIDFFGEDNCFVSYSAGKDSTVLKDLAGQGYNIESVYFDTGLEYPENVAMAKAQGATVIKTNYSFKKLGEERGYPVVSKEMSKYLHDVRLSKSSYTVITRLLSKNYCVSSKWLHFLVVEYEISDYCCTAYKKGPSKAFTKATGKYPIIGTRVEESKLRQNQWLRHGCNSFDNKISSKPLSLFSDEDVDTYIEEKKLELPETYTVHGLRRTGCVNCPYGAHLEKGENRFEKLLKTHPKLYRAWMKTQIRIILMDMGVEIKNDPEYMAEVIKHKAKIAAWHKGAKGSDNYLSYKIDYLKARFTPEELCQGWERYKNSNYKCRYEAAEVEEKLF